MKASVPDLDAEAARADDKLMAAGFERAHWADIGQTLYTLRLGLWVVRAWFRPHAAQLELGALQVDKYVYRGWSRPVQPTPGAVAEEALQFVAVMRDLSVPGDCGAE